MPANEPHSTNPRPAPWRYEGRTFQSLRDAMEWYYQNLPPGGVLAKYPPGVEVDPDVAALGTIERSLEFLKQDEESLEILEFHYRDGMDLARLGKTMVMSTKLASFYLRRAQSVLSTALRLVGVLNGGSWIEDCSVRP